jgi:hypothetical protein
VGWDGKVPNGQIYWTGAGCTGTAYLNDGNGGTAPFDPLWVKSATFSAAAASFMVPNTAATSGAVISGALTSAAIENPACGASAGTASGWQLKTATPAQLGLPANASDGTFATPLSIS